mmetsp:Transcript_14726/g.21032  ORF Transcript_14726/g.21032 Transcript_14726/m.21032 type:complete len:144 (-) Transcript_14726:778-1209(-)
MFCLCVDDFGVKYYCQADANHLIQSLKSNYEVTVDWEGKHFCGLTFDWKYKEGFVDVSMPRYLNEVLKRYNHTLPAKPQFSPHFYHPIIYGKKNQPQLSKKHDTSPALSKLDIKFVQGVVGLLLYYAWALDGTMLPALNEIGT